MTPIGTIIIPVLLSIIGIGLMLFVIRLILGIDKREKQLQEIIELIEKENKN